MLETCTILTTEANAAVEPVHHRMPVIVPRERVEPWLAGEDMALAGPYPPESMRVRPVNCAAHDDARCIEPVVLE